jgi:hypothetical protein
MWSAQSISFAHVPPFGRNDVGRQGRASAHDRDYLRHSNLRVADKYFQAILRPALGTEEVGRGNLCPRPDFFRNQLLFE